MLEGQRKESSVEVRVYQEGFLKELGLRLEGKGGFVPVVKRVASLNRAKCCLPIWENGSPDAHSFIS